MSTASQYAKIPLTMRCARRAASKDCARNRLAREEGKTELGFPHKIAICRKPEHMKSTKKYNIMGF